MRWNAPILAVSHHFVTEEFQSSRFRCRGKSEVGDVGFATSAFDKFVGEIFAFKFVISEVVRVLRCAKDSLKVAYGSAGLRRVCFVDDDGVALFVLWFVDVLNDVGELLQGSDDDLRLPSNQGFCKLLGVFFDLGD